MSLSIEDEAIAMNLAMNLDTGRLDFSFIVNDMQENWQDWKQIIEFWQSIRNRSEMIDTLLNRLLLEFQLLT
jgi:hypothetical protein